MDTIQAIMDRRSVRKYKKDRVKGEDLRTILEAGRQAPSGGNRQPWEFVIVKDERLREKVAEACNGQMWIADAPAILCLVTEPGEGSVNGTIVLDHAILAATSLGYGTCWIGAYDAAKVKEVLGIPDDHGIICLTPVGLPAEHPAARPRKSPTELFMKERFGSPLDYSL